jgi:hypothetical protein
VRIVTAIADMEKEIGDLRHKIAEREKQVQEMKDRLAAAPPLPPAIDTTEIRAKIEAARKTNTNVRALDKKLAHVKRAQQLESESEQLTGRMKDRDEAKRAAIAAAKMPIEGLAFGEGVVLLNSVPFEQASDAEQLRASVAIAAALNPKLRVIRIRDGSLLDDQAMRWLGEFAQSLDMQIWIERVDSSGSVGFVIEDGHVKAAQTEGEAA